MSGPEHMDRLTGLDLRDSYDTVDDDPIHEFLVPSLSVSSKYFRAVGYFSSAILAVLAEAFTDFAERGGKMRLVCSPFLSAQDAQILEELSVEGYKQSLDSALESLEGTGEASAPLNLMAKLIKMGSLELKIAIPKPGTVGLFHQKIGYFEDLEGNRVSFEGSNNETLSAWATQHNSEAFTVYRGWADFTEVKHSKRIAGKFSRFWLNEYPGFDFVDFSKGLQFIQKRENEDVPLSELKNQVRKWVRDKPKPTQSEGDSTPKLELRPYQAEVLENWKKLGHRGVISFATGAGKTITALSAVNYWLSSPQGRGCLILVPSVRLQKQWISEISRQPNLAGIPVLPVGGIGITKIWRNGLNAFSNGSIEGEKAIVLAVMDSASTSAFRSRIGWGPQLLIVADEMHNLGASSFEPLLGDADAGAYLGLSATPSRYDEAETDRIRAVFGPDLEPVIDIKAAQSLGVLVSYTYETEFVGLNDEEEEKYGLLTAEINQLVAIKAQNGKLSLTNENRLKQLSMERARIIKKASSKIPLARKLLLEHYEEGDRWLVFLEDADQLESLKTQIAELKPYSLHMKMAGDADATLEAYKELGGVMLAIQMMDEGVDVPSINKALIVSSSQNPRQYIQRRGRILRLDPSRPKVAKILDLVVLDRDGLALNDREIDRCVEFARDAINSGSVIEYEQLRRKSDLGVGENV